MWPDPWRVGHLTPNRNPPSGGGFARARGAGHPAGQGGVDPDARVLVAELGPVPTAQVSAVAFDLGPPATIPHVAASASSDVSSRQAQSCRRRGPGPPMVLGLDRSSLRLLGKVGRHGKSPKALDSLATPRRAEQMI